MESFLEYLFQVDWAEILFPDTPIAEIFVRGTITYLALFLLFRLVLKRQAGSIGMSDLLVVVLVADAAQGAMSGGYEAVPDGLLLVGTIVFWAYTLDWLGYKFPFIQRFVHPPPLILVENGQMNRRNMRKEFITEEELKSMLRQQGINDLSRVETAHLEGNGRISVVAKEERRHDPMERHGV